MTVSIQEKRRFPRKSLQQPAEVLDNDTGVLIGVLEDVSRGGFALVTDHQFIPAEQRNVTLILPGPLGTHHLVSMVAECVWCQSLNRKQGFVAGFSLKAIQDQDLVALNYFIRDYQVVPEPVLS